MLRLYVTGMTPRSTRAIEPRAEICEELLAGRYDLEIIDVYQQPALARRTDRRDADAHQELPLPQRRVIGDMSNTERVLVGLDLRTAR